MHWLALAYSLPVLFVSVILHEIAHGKVAEWLGDPTARQLGRITLNPIRHIDFFLTILLPGLLILSGSPIIFGGAKPVPVNPWNFRHPRQDMAIVAIAGPITNVVLALLSYGVMVVLDLVSPFVMPLGFPDLDLVTPFFAVSVILNLVLAAFNMLPFPPLDGGRIAVGVLPEQYARAWSRLEPLGLLIVVILLYTGMVDLVLGPVYDFAVALVGE